MPVALYGPNNRYLRLLKSLFPKLRIMARNDVIRVLGEEEELTLFCSRIEEIQQYLLLHNTIDEEQLVRIATGKGTSAAETEVIVYNIAGKPIKSRNKNQAEIVKQFSKKDLLFITGPAGTGKTYLSIALAVRALKEKAVRRIILSRPAVEAGEKLGFLPGDMKEKIDPYLQPLYDATIEIAPLAFMRGRTLNDAVVILDEAQNTTPAQLRMFLTRMGNNTKMIVTGDITQADLPKGQLSGLKHAIPLLKDIEGIAIIGMNNADIVRHKLVTRIVKAYESATANEESKTDEVKKGE